MVAPVAAIIAIQAAQRSMQQQMMSGGGGGGGLPPDDDFGKWVKWAILIFLLAVVMGVAGGLLAVWLL